MWVVVCEVEREIAISNVMEIDENVKFDVIYCLLNLDKDQVEYELTTSEDKKFDSHFDVVEVRQIFLERQNVSCEVKENENDDENLTEDKEKDIHMGREDKDIEDMA